MKKNTTEAVKAPQPFNRVSFRASFLPEFYALTVGGIWKVADTSIKLVRSSGTSPRLTGAELTHARFIAVTSRFVGFCDQHLCPRDGVVKLTPWEDLPVSYHMSVTPPLIGLFSTFDAAAAAITTLTGDIAFDRHRAEDATMEVLRQIGAHHPSFIVSRPHPEFGFNIWWYGAKGIGIERNSDPTVPAQYFRAAELDEPDDDDGKGDDVVAPEKPVRVEKCSRKGRPPTRSRSAASLAEQNKEPEGNREMVRQSSSKVGKPESREGATNTSVSTNTLPEPAPPLPKEAAAPVASAPAVRTNEVPLSGPSLTGVRYRFQLFCSRPVTRFSGGTKKTDRMGPGTYVMVRVAAPDKSADPWWVIEAELPDFVGRPGYLWESWAYLSNGAFRIEITPIE